MDLHQIHRQTIELHVPREEGTETLRAQTAEAIEAAFAACFDRVADRVLGSRTVYIPTLNLDLGHLGEAPELVPDRLEAALEEALRGALEAVETTEAAGETPPDAWSTFLHTGNLPWDAPAQDRTAVQALFAERGSTPATLQMLAGQPTALLRVLRHLPDTTLLQHWPAHLAHPLPTTRLQPLLQALPTTEQARQHFWETLLRLGQSASPTEERLQTLLRTLLARVPGPWQLQALPQGWHLPFPASLPQAPLQALLQALPTTEQARQHFWQTLLRLGQSAGSTEERLQTLLSALLAAVPGPWQHQAASEAWPPPAGAQVAKATWQNLAAPQPHPTAAPKASLTDWLAHWKELVAGPLAEVGQLQKILDHLKAAKSHLQATPLQRPLADLLVLVQGRLRQRQRQARGLSPEALATLQTLADTLSATDPDYWLALRQALHQAIPAFRLAETDHQDTALMDWLRHTLAWRAPATEPYPPIVAAWRQWIFAPTPTSPEQWQQEHAASLHRLPHPVAQLLQQWLTKPNTPVPATIAPAHRPWLAWARHLATQPLPSPPPSPHRALVLAWQAYLQQGTALPQAAISLLSPADQTTLAAWLQPQHPPLPNLENTLPLLSPNPTVAPSPAREHLREWLHLHQHLPAAKVQQELQPELRWFQQEFAHHQNPKTQAPNRSTSPEALPEYYVHTSGLVLLWPFIRPLFMHLGLLDAEAHFLSPEHQNKAVMVLYTLATGLHQAAEPELALCKVLAGLPPDAPVPVVWEPTEEDLAEMDQLLSSALQPSPRLSSSGPASFRANFLLRQAVLRPPGHSWVLDVERKPYDLLLASLPWQWSVIKLPWLPEIIHVSWGREM